MKPEEILEAAKLLNRRTACLEQINRVREIQDDVIDIQPHSIHNARRVGNPVRIDKTALVGVIMRSMHEMDARLEELGVVYEERNRVQHQAGADPGWDGHPQAQAEG